MQSFSYAKIYKAFFTSSKIEWQDLALMLGTILLSYALVPQVIYGFKKKKRLVTLQTSGLSAAGLLILNLSFYSLKLPLALTANVIAMVLWSVLFFQSLVYPK